jgi:hypothetical protein
MTSRAVDRLDALLGAAFRLPVVHRAAQPDHTVLGSDLDLARVDVAVALEALAPPR